LAIENILQLTIEQKRCFGIWKQLGYTTFSQI